MKAVRPAQPATGIPRCWLRSGLDVVPCYGFGPRSPDALSAGAWLCRTLVQAMSYNVGRIFKRIA